MTILESKGILIKDQNYHVVLTNRRILLTSAVDQKLRSINLPDVQKIEVAADDSGDPVIILFVPSVVGEVKKVILHFSQKNFPDPRQVCSLWSSEITTRIQSTVPVSPGITPKKGSSPPAFCVACGKKVVDGSVFCNNCGTKIIYPVQPIPLQQGEESIQENVKTPDISMGKIEIKQEPVKPEQEKISLSSVDDSDTKEQVPLIAALPKEDPERKSFFAGSDKRKHAVIAVSALVVVILLIAAFFVLIPSGSRGFNLTFPGMNSTVPEINTAASTANPLVTTTTITTTNPAIPETTPVPEIPSAQPSFTSAPGDPSSVLVSYSSLFNTGNGAGLAALLSENMKSHYPINMLNSELSTARSNGYTIEKIQVTNQIIEENSAILEVAISWKVAGSPATSTPRFFLVYENNQWKLDSLIVNPQSS